MKKRLMKNPRLVKDDSTDADDNKSIAQLILDNKSATIKKGRMYKQGRVMRNWKSRYFVLSVSKIEYFKNPSSTTPRGEMSFLDHRCTVRSLPATGDVVCKSPNVTAEYLLEMRVGDRRLVMACTSESDKRLKALQTKGEACRGCATRASFRMRTTARRLVARAARTGASPSLPPRRKRRTS